jgi:hypothetical protein
MEDLSSNRQKRDRSEVEYQQLNDSGRMPLSQLHLFETSEADCVDERPYKKAHYQNVQGDEGSRGREPMHDSSMVVGAPPPADQGDVGTVLLDTVHHDQHAGHHAAAVDSVVMPDNIEPAVVEVLAGIGGGISSVPVINASHLMAMSSNVGNSCTLFLQLEVFFQKTHRVAFLKLPRYFALGMKPTKFEHSKLKCLCTAATYSSFFPVSTAGGQSVSGHSLGGDDPMNSNRNMQHREDDYSRQVLNFVLHNFCACA